jgi:ribonuclease HI
MKQLGLFDNEIPEPVHKKTKTCGSNWKLFIDGAARNNPGPAGAGIYILKDSEFFKKNGFYLGSKTNNQAEYFALLIGLFLLKKELQPGDTIHIISDSQLLIRQMKGEYKVKNPELKTLHTFAHHLLHELHAQLFHVLRIDNQEADAMANYGIDKKVKPPQAFITMIKQHAISL